MRRASGKRKSGLWESNVSNKSGQHFFQQNMGLGGAPFFQKIWAPGEQFFSEKFGPRWSKKGSLQLPYHFLTNECREIT